MYVWLNLDEVSRASSSSYCTSGSRTSSASPSGLATWWGVRGSGFGFGLGLVFGFGFGFGFGLGLRLDLELCGGRQRVHVLELRRQDGLA